MKRLLTLVLALAAALAPNLGAEGLSLEEAMSRLQGGAGAPAVQAPAAPVPAAVPQDAPAAPREWLFLVFINGVNDLGILGFANNDINEMEAVGSSDRVAVVVEFGILGVDNQTDRNLQFQRGSRTIYVTRDADPSAVTSPVIYSSNDADMGSEANLVRFVKRGLRRYPARKVALVVWNHGAGRLGISFDDVSKNHMEVDRLGAALAQVKAALGRPLDVFATDACLMQMASVAYEFRDSAEVIVGSEEIIPGNGYPYTPILAGLVSNPGMGAEELARGIVDSYAASYRADATLSALRGAALDGLRQAIDGWVAAVRSDPQAFAAASDPALLNSVSHFSYRDSKDLIDYINKVEARLPASPGVKAAGAAVKGRLAAALVRNAVKPAADNTYTAAKGLAVYVPDLRYASDNYERLAFAADSQWDDFLLDLMRERLK